MRNPLEGGLKLQAALLTLFLLELFVGWLIAAGYNLTVALAAASAVGLTAAEISARLGRDGGSPPAISS
ncbi:MAG: hypothetical protein ACRDPY_08540 [Streptosporangiaceae bacterium]